MSLAAIVVLIGTAVAAVVAKEVSAEHRLREQARAFTEQRLGSRKPAIKRDAVKQMERLLPVAGAAIRRVGTRCHPDLHRAAIRSSRVESVLQVVVRIRPTDAVIRTAGAVVDVQPWSQHVVAG